MDSSEKDIQLSHNKDHPKPPFKLKIVSQTISRHLESMRVDAARNTEVLHSAIKPVIPNEIWEVPGFLSARECEDLIKETEEMGFEDATKSASNSLLRNMRRLFVSDLQTAELLASKMRTLLPLCFEGGLFTSLSENLKFYKYERGQKYEKHVDGVFENDLLQTKSVASFLIYLNEPVKGGSTRFHSHKFEKGYHDVKPEKGKLLIYRQKGWLHQALAVESGVKYVLRGDAMYRWLNNEEIESLQSTKCRLCDSELKVMDLFSCDHQLIRCNCVQFHEELHAPDQSPKLGQCKWCKKSYQLENKRFFGFMDETNWCRIY